MNEAEVIKGCLKNDRSAQKTLYEHFYGRMMGVCMRYSKNKDEAKDILHEGFMKVFTSIKHFSSKGSFEGWVKRIMVNTAIDHLRQNRHQYLIVNTVYATDKANKITAADENEEQIIDRISKDMIMQAVEQLTPAYRTVFNLYVVDEYSHKEISEMLDISEGTSKSNLSKAKFILKKNLIHLLKPVT